MNSNHKINKIGITGHYFIDWMGGYDFIRSVVDSLLAVDDRKFKIYLILPIRGYKSTLIRCLRVIKDVVKRRVNRYPNHKKIYEIAKDTFDKRVEIRLIDYGEASLNRFCKINNIDILIPAGKPFGKKIKTPWIGWVGDFQHKNLTNFFSKKEIADRDIFFKKMFLKAKSVIVNSKTVGKEALEYYPNKNCKIYPMPFNASISNKNVENIFEVKKKYRIREDFFMCSNQFWMHKDHPTLFKAFAIFCSRNHNIKLICTGELREPRNSSYIPYLHKLIEELGISQRVSLLGLIPKAEQLTLMSSAIALIQPSLSEGGPGGGAGFEAVALGVRCILSDISVNKEIMQERVRFFEKGKPDSLFNEMLYASENLEEAPALEYLHRKSQERKLACGKLLFAAMDELIG
jgi:glycosyltransferase involved in cell wall biosynthesis